MSRQPGRLCLYDPAVSLADFEEMVGFTMFVDKRRVVYRGCVWTVVHEIHGRYGEQERWKILVEWGDKYVFPTVGCREGEGVADLRLDKWP